MGVSCVSEPKSPPLASRLNHQMVPGSVGLDLGGMTLDTPCGQRPPRVPSGSRLETPSSSRLESAGLDSDQGMCTPMLVGCQTPELTRGGSPYLVGKPSNAGFGILR